MRSVISRFLVCGIVVWSIASVRAAEPAAKTPAATGKDPAVSRQRYEAVSGKLDTGGDLFIVANVEGFLRDLVNDIVAQVDVLMPTADAGAKQAKATILKVPGFLQKHGFYAVEGLGFSIVPRTDGLSMIKGYVARNAAAMDLPLWRGLVGGQPKKLVSPTYLPADTVMAQVGTGEPAQLWKFVKTCVTELGGTNGAVEFAKWQATAATNLGMSVDTLMQSLAGEGFVSLQLSETATVDIPNAGGREPIKIPQPSLLIGMAVNGDALMKMIVGSLARVQMPITETPVESVAIKTVALPIPIPFPLAPSFAIHSNFFLFGSSPQVITAALEAQKSGNGLAGTAHYKKVTAGLPTVNNGMSYLNPRFMAAVVNVQMAAASQSGQNTAALQTLLNRRAKAEGASITLNMPAGIQTMGSSTANGKELVGGALLAPVGLMAAIAIPSFVKARTTSRGNACINNLRQIDAAKEQWAMANNKQDGDPVDIDGISEYIRGNQLPVCPQGGTYNVNVIGTDPACSIPEHRLNGF